MNLYRTVSLLIALLLLAPGALACSVKSGFIAKGLAKTPAYLTPICDDLYTSWKAEAVDGQTLQWGEVFLVRAGAGEQAGEFVDHLMTENRFESVHHEESPDGTVQTFGFRSGTRLLIMQVVGLEGNLYFTFAGNY
ncbi:hypothetical protein HNR42_003371 [Deinobacterium chartae]|uniref:Uncharacterized protein n=1 Tax=Deinobacterium chartae TaxID=521158 RepID=A0A841I262_9DEIO|nr:hypothetical protein [Deinobacterium chartae]MBB6099911.1 hypothetical protein [Deinobacterium chartae]